MKKRFVLPVILILVTAMMCAACGSSYAKRADSGAAYEEAKAESSYEYYEEPAEAAAEDYWEEETAEKEASGESGAYTAEQENGTTLTNDKLVYTCNLDIQTTEYQKTIQAIREKIRQYNAIIEYESETDSDYKWYYSGHVKNSGTMSLSMRVRVPVANYNAFVTDAGDFGKVTSKSQNVENISRKYHNTETRIESLTKEEARLLEMMDKADTIEEMIYIEQRLTDVEAELNSYKSSLEAMDVDVAYSTVNLNVKEVFVYAEPDAPTVTFGQRIAKAFKESWEGFKNFLEGLLIVIIHLLPFLAAGLIVAGIVIGYNKAADKRDPGRKERRRKAKEEKRAAKEAAKARKKYGRGYYPPVPPSPEKPAEAPKSGEEK